MRPCYHQKKDLEISGWLQGQLQDLARLSFFFDLLSAYALADYSFLRQQSSVGILVLKPMPRRAIVLIVGFWAFLTIITPTLILWSKSERDSLQHSSGWYFSDLVPFIFSSSTAHMHTKIRVSSIPEVLVLLFWFGSFALLSTFETFSGVERVEISARKMMGYPERLHLMFAQRSPPIPPPALPSLEPSPPPSPSPASSPDSSPHQTVVTWDGGFRS